MSTIVVFCTPSRHDLFKQMSSILKLLSLDIRQEIHDSMVLLIPVVDSHPY